MKSCRKFKSLIDLYLDSEASSRQTRTLFSHIENCERCRARLEETRKLHHAIGSVPSVDLPDGFRRAVLERIQNEGYRHHRSIRLFPAISWAGAVAAILLVAAVLWYMHSPEPVLAVPEIQIVSPREDAVIEKPYVDISAVFSPDGESENIQVILDGRDVTHATEINEDFLIYASDALQSGYHMVTVQIMDNKGSPITQRSWAFYVYSPV
jgi:anti-sigma factor RsiW